MLLHSRASAIAVGLALYGFNAAPSTQHTNNTASITPTEAVNELLAADRTFAAASGKTDLITGLAAMFSERVTMPLPNATWAEGKQAVVEALRRNTDNSKSRVEWTPIRGGISADGTQGFTFGYMTLRKPDSSLVPLKYMSYWVKETNGWRVVAYKRAVRPAGVVSLALMPPALPAKLVAATSDTAVISAHETGLRQAEQAFSDEAQKIGVGPAFRKYGTADAVNMGRTPEYVIGAEQIGGPPDTTATPFAWKSDKVIVASSGDLGVSIGFIRPHGNPSKPIPFFTIWRRGSPGAPWRYVAE